MTALLLNSILALLLTNFIHHFLIIRYDIFSFLKIPIDLRKSFRGQRIFGDSKTLRGFLVDIIPTGLFLFLLMTFFVKEFQVSKLFFGFLLGFGYAFGELPTSFLKRQFKIDPGKQGQGSLGIFFSILEQADSIIGVLIVVTIFLKLNLFQNLTLFLIGVGLHLSIDLFLHIYGYKRGLQIPFLKH